VTKEKENAAVLPLELGYLGGNITADDGRAFHSAVSSPDEKTYFRVALSRAAYLAMPA
jgi:hypothetical protein